MGELLGTVSHSLRSPFSSCLRGVEFLGHDIFFVILLNPLSIQDTLLCVLYILIVEVFIHFSTFIFVSCYSSPLGWMRSSSSSAWKVKPVLTPSTATLPKWHSSVNGFSSSLLSSVVAGSTLGPAGAGSIGTGHNSLAGYNNNVGGSALSCSALNLHSSSSSSSNAASLSTNGALAARGMKAQSPHPVPQGIEYYNSLSWPLCCCCCFFQPCLI